MMQISVHSERVFRTMEYLQKFRNSKTYKSFQKGNRMDDCLRSILDEADALGYFVYNFGLDHRAIYYLMGQFLLDLWDYPPVNKLIMVEREGTPKFMVHFERIVEWTHEQQLAEHEYDNNSDDTDMPLEQIPQFNLFPSRGDTEEKVN